MQTQAPRAADARVAGSQGTKETALCLFSWLDLRILLSFVDMFFSTSWAFLLLFPIRGPSMSGFNFLPSHLRMAMLSYQLFSTSKFADARSLIFTVLEYSGENMRKRISSYDLLVPSSSLIYCLHPNVTWKIAARILLTPQQQWPQQKQQDLHQDLRGGKPPWEVFTFNLRSKLLGKENMGKHHFFVSGRLFQFVVFWDCQFVLTKQLNSWKPGRMVIHHHWMACRFLSDKVIEYMQKLCRINMYITGIHGNPTSAPHQTYPHQK